MPAPFVKALCSYRASNGKPNTSDAHDNLSVELGSALFDEIGVDRAARSSDLTGKIFADHVVLDLKDRARRHAGGIKVVPERPLNAFDQYRHIGRLRNIEFKRSAQFIKTWAALERTAQSPSESEIRSRLTGLIADLDGLLENEANARRELIEGLGDESLLGLDVTVATENDAHRPPQLEIGLSLKWSLRTDRAQDCRSQGAKMAALRRGRMPHFAVVTMEPRPYMLNLLAGGSGDVDCVYHLDLPSLVTAIETVYRSSAPRIKARDQFRRLVDQRRIRDWDDLTHEVEVLSQR
ncbi:NgoMIV family type II restriction endonuclease [Curtobacterium poinsettiae]|uniref:NgoMIV family type II restriction endonuclease n=1 Tax=Curtobacterium poinsettiae TaxID=159612 RepID=UPI0021C9FE7A|nr:NgoMIV family type II restriction endonuclease [Curtobacterium flaccumfaciens]MCU0114878.1 hypothetical protein [Curtobacterium flaccumfaciens]